MRREVLWCLGSLRSLFPPTLSGAFRCRNCHTHQEAAAPAQVVAELAGEFPAEFIGKLRVQLQAGKEAGQAQALQVTVSEASHICIGLDPLLPGGDVATNQVSLT